VSQLLQKEDQDISNASATLNRAINMMKALRCSFDEVHEEAVNVAGIWCVNTTFTEKRIGRAPRMYDEKATDQRLQDPVKRFQVNVFNASTDIVIAQLQRRFTGVDIVASIFQCLSPQFLSADDIIYQSAASLVATYFNDLSDSFTTQLLSFRALFKDEWTI